MLNGAAMAIQAFIVTPICCWVGDPPWVKTVFGYISSQPLVGGGCGGHIDDPVGFLQLPVSPSWPISSRLLWEPRSPWTWMRLVLCCLTYNSFAFGLLTYCRCSYPLHSSIIRYFTQITSFLSKKPSQRQRMWLFNRLGNNLIVVQKPDSWNFACLWGRLGGNERKIWGLTRLGARGQVRNRRTIVWSPWHNFGHLRTNSDISLTLTYHYPMCQENAKCHVCLVWFRL